MDEDAAILKNGPGIHDVVDQFRNCADSHFVLKVSDDSGWFGCCSNYFDGLRLILELQDWGFDDIRNFAKPRSRLLSAAGGGQRTVEEFVTGRLNELDVMGARYCLAWRDPVFRKPILAYSHAITGEWALHELLAYLDSERVRLSSESACV